MSLVLSILALAVSPFAATRYYGLPLFLSLLCVGMGNIYIAFVAIVLTLSLISFRVKVFDVPLVVIPVLLVVFFVTTVGIVIAGPSWVMIKEFLQLIAYSVILCLLLNLVKIPEFKSLFLFMLAFSGGLVAFGGISMWYFQLTEVPHIYIGRGGNEGSIFTVIAGVIPAILLLNLNNRKDLRVCLCVCLLLCLCSQWISTSRSSLAFSVVLILLNYVFSGRSRILAAIISIATLLGLAIFVGLNAVNGLLEQQVNYSALERIRLYALGYDLWLQNPIIGYGWGSSEEILSGHTSLGLQYPHFHSSYVQLLVELGLLGFLISAVVIGYPIILAAGALLRLIGADDKEFRTKLLFSSGLAMSFLVEAMLYGADRAVLVAIAIAFILRSNPTPSQGK